MRGPKRLWEGAGIKHPHEGDGVVKCWTKDEVTAYFYVACAIKTVPFSSVALHKQKNEPFDGGSEICCSDATRRAGD